MIPLLLFSLFSVICYAQDGTIDPDVPGLVKSVELYVQTRSSASVTFEPPDYPGKSPIDKYLIEWSTSSSFENAIQGVVLVTPIHQSSFQFDIVGLPDAMEERLFARVSAHNSFGWSTAQASTPVSVSIAELYRPSEPPTTSWWTRLGMVLFVCLIGLVIVTCIAGCLRYYYESNRSGFRGLHEDIDLDSRPFYQKYFSDINWDQLDNNRR
eukprot:TRINITY_DN10589_c0_g1_i1.p1 TRINITY_DN10589_c0_g1~~TRINITY_DN10589_c0_g1_i1.p1  ORF type:complete len:211 (+),score=23.19 TRINITY_DN10589_c0_g1_i1:81-713(+)